MTIGDRIIEAARRVFGRCVKCGKKPDFEANILSFGIAEDGLFIDIACLHCSHVERVTQFKKGVKND